MIDYAAEIKERVTCQQFADFIGLKVNKQGFAVCPFHGDNDASLKIYKGGRGWCCFGCHKGGDVINFASAYYGTRFADTLKRLNDDFHLRLMQESSETAQNRALMAVEIAKRKTARLKEERLRAALECDYWIAFDKWLNNDRIIQEQAPQAYDAEFSEEFASALRDRETIRAELIDLEMRRITYEPQ